MNSRVQIEHRLQRHAESLHKISKAIVTAWQAVGISCDTMTDLFRRVGNVGSPESKACNVPCHRETSPTRSNRSLVHIGIRRTRGNSIDANNCGRTFRILGLKSNIGFYKPSGLSTGRVRALFSPIQIVPSEEISYGHES